MGSDDHAERVLGHNTGSNPQADSAASRGFQIGEAASHSLGLDVVVIDAWVAA
jgi:hypothetical protein